MQNLLPCAAFQILLSSTKQNTFLQWAMVRDTIFYGRLQKHNFLVQYNKIKLTNKKLNLLIIRRTCQ